MKTVLKRRGGKLRRIRVIEGDDVLAGLCGIGLAMFILFGLLKCSMIY